MTVCVAVRSFNAVFLVSDRMITSGDIQFEPPVQKIISLTSSISVMAAGDNAFNAEIMTEVYKTVWVHVKATPEIWWRVKDVAELYLKCRNDAKLKRAEAALLAPLGLDRNSFLEKQQIMDSDLVSNLSRDLINFDVPRVSVIIAGLDDYLGPSAHIYTVHDDNISCDDTVGFRAIGSGSRHAESQLMASRHAWNSNTAEALFGAYCAKKKSEVAPGVGPETDMFLIGPALGQTTQLNPDTMKKLEDEYEKFKQANDKIQSETNAEINRYVDEVSQKSAAAQGSAPKVEQQESVGADKKDAPREK